MFYFLIQCVLVIGAFAFWMLDPVFMSLNYYIYHICPLFMAFVVLLFQRSFVKRKGAYKLLGILLPYTIWLTGVYYIYENTTL
ncbi:hypothetical protein IMZ31_23150 (plasmid) [Pontibacillus sp. ALD_SL1]|uniref:hypothetical protein n=1 Tax=Pontibacillus sp. ALD_SL1 TaxID=2777185 RepID=UPI001A964EE4|nr:hypothetical protein [Pontibacillus sp. ALD_SL1]QST02351.1 hypothetical protein IMZ31_23150 [Pontibacillus sp. ALD_SL1]